MWIKGKPETSGVYWLAEYIGHGAFGVSLAQVFYDYPEYERESAEFPKPNNGSGAYTGDALRALMEYEETHEQTLLYRRLSHGETRILDVHAARIEYFMEIEIPDLPGDLDDE